MRHLVLLRHAQAEASADGDFGRRLTARGREDALHAGQELARRDLVPDLAVASPAPRAWDTAVLACGALGIGQAGIRPELGVYGAEPAALLRLLGRLPAARRVLLVGHNPGLQDVAVHLTGDADLARVGLAPGGFVAMELPESWADLGAKAALRWERGDAATADALG